MAPLCRRVSDLGRPYRMLRAFRCVCITNRLALLLQGGAFISLTYSEEKSRRDNVIFWGENK